MEDLFTFRVLFLRRLEFLCGGPKIWCCIRSPYHFMVPLPTEAVWASARIPSVKYVTEVLQRVNFHCSVGGYLIERTLSMSNEAWYVLALK